MVNKVLEDQNLSVTRKVIKVHSDDNVAVAVIALSKGFKLPSTFGDITLVEDVPAGHKIALADLPVGSQIVKYGYSIGATTQAITKGCRIYYL